MTDERRTTKDERREKQNNRPEDKAQSSALYSPTMPVIMTCSTGIKDYASEADYVAGLITKYHSAAESILELGSGTGIHASLLAEKGFTVHGIERSQEMLVRSQALTQNLAAEPGRLTFSPGDIREIRLNKLIDAVIALFHVMSYQTTNDDVTAAFETARHHLNTGGLFIFDVWYGPAVLTDRPAVRIKRMADDRM